MDWTKTGRNTWEAWLGQCLYAVIRYHDEYGEPYFLALAGADVLDTKIGSHDEAVALCEQAAEGAGA